MCQIIHLEGTFISNVLLSLPKLRTFHSSNMSPGFESFGTIVGLLQPHLEQLLHVIGRVRVPGTDSMHDITWYSKLFF